ncbi:YycC family protein [Paenibacillus sp. KN14-4R]|uniref:YycC family protein n=1 Tax=Paenibacillus sp. KN14-4R TaxID=3445773 RepID=UPI003FA134C0
MQPLQISADTAIKLAAKMKVPIEHIMHMPRHILVEKLVELAKEEAETAAEASSPKDDNTQ